MGPTGGIEMACWGRRGWSPFWGNSAIQTTVAHRPTIAQQSKTVNRRPNHNARVAGRQSYEENFIDRLNGILEEQFEFMKDVCKLGLCLPASTDCNVAK